MSGMRYVFIGTILLLLAGIQTLHSQEMVVSEYYNIQFETSEWSEFIVVKDNLNAAGYMISDANTGQNIRQGGPRFNDVPLWRNLRAGTIIVLWHRELPVTVTLDSNAADGYIELSSTDAKFFTTLLFPGGTTGMSLADAGDVMQIMRPDTSNVHMLAHAKPTGPIYDNAIGPKVNFDSGAVGAGRSNRITGRTLAAYSFGVTKDSAVAGFNDSRGLPNRWDGPRTFQGVPNINHWFWRETREPQWSSSPTVTVVSKTALRHVIEWTPLVDGNTLDSSTGYVVLRDTLNFASFPTNGIRDGLMITKGARIGTAVVLDVRPTIIGQRYTDSLNLFCGQSYTYRVYGYRYRQDDQLALTDDTTARGRQYNELRFAQSAVVSKPNPTKPLIQASRIEFCPGDTVTLTTAAVADRYDWTLNGGPLAVGGTTRVVVREPGVYRLTVTADGGCMATSDAITLTTLPAQEVEVTPSGTQTICATDSVTITALTDAPAYQWIRDGNVIGGATFKTFTARTPGDYQVRISSAAGCPGISQSVRIKTPDVRYRFEPNTLNFGVLGQCKSDTTLSIELVNEGKVAITITTAAFPPGYALSSPAPGFVVGVGERQVVQILFAPATAGVSTGTATFAAVPCNITASFSVRGERIQVSAALDRARVDFGTYTVCPTTVIKPDSTFRITNSGTSIITVRVPRVDPPFYLLTDFPAPIPVPPGGSLPIQIQYRPLGADRDRGVIQQISFPFSSSTCNDMLRAQLQAASYKPAFVVDEDSIDVGVVLWCSSSFDTSFVVSNPKPVPITITGVVGSGWTFLGSPTTIEPNTSRSIPVRIQPAGTPGAFAMVGELTADPCALKSPVHAEGIVIAPSYSSATAMMDFGARSACGPVQPLVRPSFVVAKGLSGLRSTVRSVAIGGPFTADIVVGRTFVDTLFFNVTFTAPGLGSFSDSLNVELGPCGSPLSIELTGEITSSGRTTTMSSSGFGVLAPGETSTQTIRVTNTGSDTIAVESLDGIVAPFRVLSSMPTLPTRLSPGADAEIVIEYAFAGYDRRDSLTIISRTTGVCQDTIKLPALGSTTSPGTLPSLFVSAPTNIVGKVGTIVEVPISIESTVPLDSVKITTITIYVSYDGSLLKALSVNQGTNGFQASIVESSVGKARIVVTNTIPIVAASPLVRVAMQTYVSSSNTSVFSIDSTVVTGAVVTGRDGNITVLADCQISASTAGVGQAVALRMSSVDGNTIGFEITTLTDDLSNVDLYDFSGRRISSPLSAQLPVGSYHITLDVSQNPSGVYQLVFRHGRHTISQPVFLVR